MPYLCKGEANLGILSAKDSFFLSLGLRWACTLACHPVHCISSAFNKCTLLLHFWCVIQFFVQEDQEPEKCPRGTHHSVTQWLLVLWTPVLGCGNFISLQNKLERSHICSMPLTWNTAWVLIPLSYADLFAFVKLLNVYSSFFSVFSGKSRRGRKNLVLSCTVIYNGIP